MRKIMLLTLLAGLAASTVFSRETNQSKVQSRRTPTQVEDHAAEVEDVKITILSDMVVSRWTRGEWGFAALVEVKTEGSWKKLLFDTGAEPNTVLENAKRAKIELCDVETVVLSHNHQDHVMGLVALRESCMEKNPRAFKIAVVANSKIFWSRLDSDGVNDNVMAPHAATNIRQLGLPSKYDRGVQALYKKLGGEFVEGVEGKGSFAIPGFRGIWATGEIPRPFDEKTYPAQLRMIDPVSGDGEIDKVPEDQALVINTSKGVIVLTGCAHAGPINTMTAVASAWPECKVARRAISDSSIHSLHRLIANSTAKSRVRSRS